MGITQSIQGLNRPKRWRKGEFVLLAWDELSFSSPQTPELLVPMSSDSDWITPLAILFFNLHMANCRTSASVITWANSYNELYIHSVANFIINFIYSFCFLWRTLNNIEPNPRVAVLPTSTHRARPPDSPSCALSITVSSAPCVQGVIKNTVNV